MSTGTYAFGRHVLDTARRELLREGASVALPARVFDCLAYLLLHRDRAVGRDELISAVYGRADVSDAQLAQLILRARRAIDDDGQEQHTIRTIPRFGFRWVADAVPLEPSPPRAAQATAPTDPAATPAPDQATAAAPLELPCPPTPPSPDAAPGVAGTTAHRARGRRVAWPLLIVATCVLALGAVSWWRTSGNARVAAVDTRAPLVVLPAQADGDDEGWIRLGLMDLVASQLRQAGMPVAPSDTVLALLPHGGAADPAHLRERTGANHLVGIRVRQGRDEWEVELAATDRDGIRLRASAREPALMDAARAASDRLLAALGRTPAPREQDPGLDEHLLRAQAAMLANELDVAREILVTAARLRRDDPRLRYQLVLVDYREGRYEQALAEIDALLALEADPPVPLLRARLLNTRGAIGIRIDRYAEAERDFEAALALFAADEDPAEWARARTGLGIARMVQGKVEAAALDLAQAREQALRVGDAVGLARVDSNLGHVERLRDRPAQALDHFAKSAQDFESLGAINELVSVQAMLIETQLQLLHNHQASLAMQRHWALRPRVRDPAQRALIDVTRAKVLLRLGRLDEAAALLEAPGRDTRPTAFQLHEYALYRVQLALASEQSARAVQQADAALRLGDELAPPLRDWLALYRERAAAASDQPPAPGSLALPPAAGASIPAQVAAAIRLSRSGQDAAAGSVFQAALEESQRSGSPAWMVEVASDYLPWLAAHGSHARIAEVAGLVAPWARRDYQSARVLAQAYRALGQADLADEAAQDMRRLAGQRRPGFADGP